MVAAVFGDALQPTKVNSVRTCGRICVPKGRNIDLRWIAWKCGSGKKELFVWKVFNPNFKCGNGARIKDDKERIKREVKLRDKLSKDEYKHLPIVRGRPLINEKVTLDGSDKTLFGVLMQPAMDLVTFFERGEDKLKMPPLPQPQLWKALAHALLKTIRSLHRKSEVAHCDIKPDNVFLVFSKQVKDVDSPEAWESRMTMNHVKLTSEIENGNVKVALGDFDHAVDLTDEKDHKVFGTVGFMAPEVEAHHWQQMRGLNVASIDKTSADMFAFGATMMNLCSGKLLCNRALAGGFEFDEVATSTLYNDEQRKCIGTFLSRFLTRTAAERCPSTDRATSNALAFLEKTSWV